MVAKICPNCGENFDGRDNAKSLYGRHIATCKAEKPVQALETAETLAFAKAKVAVKPPEIEVEAETTLEPDTEPVKAEKPPEKPAEPAKPTEVFSLAEYLEKMGNSLTPEQKALLAKAAEEEEKVKLVASTPKFKAEFDKVGWKAITDIAATAGFDLVGRKITLSFPKGKPPEMVVVPVTGGGSGGTRAGSGGFSNNGKVIEKNEKGVETPYTSLLAFAKAEKVKYHGMADAFGACEGLYGGENAGLGIPMKEAKEKQYPYRWTHEKDDKGIIHLTKVAR